ncbi:helix-turn-helix transcriptional regulator [Anaeromicropila herbilytica]|uniref:HTH cro/C1-type domain-containing protein n=1 Tax=Anaeromicropila herbilytica TaxID=2785025 RepID=A0A7R7EHZ9_9FIRM|nr:helix-turn-helix transcriptional regulator [Anaeromicropila herbilytica]BCN29098.1 hypothetical protein bsdtb5_03930 [Anaeromicropila herbilytica]
MNIKICSNILKYRKQNGVTQAELAEYLGVSPQAVSRWEQEASVPDIYLIPKISSFFGISIDTLFGTSDCEKAELLVSKYSFIQSDKNYKEAKESVDTLLEMDSDSLKALELLCRLELERGIEYIRKSKEVCMNLHQKAIGRDEDLEYRAAIQLMRTNAMLGDCSFVEDYVREFNESKTIDNLKRLIVAKSYDNKVQYEEVLRWCGEHLSAYSKEEQRKVYPILMDLAYELGNLDYVIHCFEVITEDKENTSQVFNAWWLLWKTYHKLGYDIETEKCRIELLEQLHKQNYNEYVLEQMRMHLDGKGEKLQTIL